MVRVLSAGADKWTKNPPDGDDLAKHVFAFDDPRPSVFAVESSQDEAVAVAAHQLTLKRSNIETRVLVVRIGLGILRRARVQLVYRRGSTGIDAADEAHFDLTEFSESARRDVVTTLALRFQAGEDLVRTLHKIQIENRFRDFIVAHAGVSTNAKKYSRRALGMN